MTDEKRQMMLDVKKYFIDNHLKILVRTNFARTEIGEYDKEKHILRVNVNARPENNSANIEIVKFFSRLLKQKVVIKSGLRSREKILKIES